MLKESKRVEALRLYRDGMSYNAISKALGSCKKDVSAYLNSIGALSPTNAAKGSVYSKQVCFRCYSVFGATQKQAYCSRSCRDAAQVVWDRVRILDGIRACGGNSVGQETLTTVARRMFGSWAFACDQAGVSAASCIVSSCVVCGADVPHGDGRRTHCSKACLKVSNSKRWSSYWAARLAAYADGERFKAVMVYERDAWLCGICGLPVDRALRYPNVMRASLDHVIPLSRGGVHTLDNVQLAHLSCNSSKGCVISQP